MYVCSKVAVYPTQKEKKRKHEQWPQGRKCESLSQVKVKSKYIYFIFQSLPVLETNITVESKDPHLGRALQEYIFSIQTLTKKIHKQPICHCKYSV